jgi:hypothetical protein
MSFRRRFQSSLLEGPSALRIDAPPGETRQLPGDAVFVGHKALGVRAL